MPPMRRNQRSAARPRPAIALTAELERLKTELETSRLRIRELEALIDVDPLTGTLNRRGFERELTRSLAYVKRYGASAALLSSRPRRIQDGQRPHGHAAGDAVLKAASKSLLRAVRASDVVARIGGDEFVVLLWNIDANDAAAKARLLEAAIGDCRSHGTPVRCRWTLRPAWRYSVRPTRPPRCSPRGRRNVRAQGGAAKAPSPSPRRCNFAPPDCQRPRAAARYAMMSGVSWSSMKVMRSRRYSLRFFRR